MPPVGRTLDTDPKDVDGVYLVYSPPPGACMGYRISGAWRQREVIALLSSAEPRRARKRT